MEIALERVKYCIQNNRTLLDLSDLDIVKLPDNLPTSLLILWCNNNRLTSLSDNLPASIKILYCSNNQLTSLPDILPASLHALYCSYNKLTSLPDILPASLKTLFCDNNQLTSLPDNLPVSLQNLYYSSNPYLHITKTQAIRFNRKETPNYVKYANIIKNRRKAMKRYKRLKFCKKLEEHATEFLLRPGNYYYILLERNNSHLFMQNR